jgi:hypothetical protein
VLGNPPWERIKLQEQEFFASRDPEVAQARNQAERRKKIDALAAAPAGSLERRLYDEFEEARHVAEAASLFAHDGGRYPLTGTGDVNTYALFAETAVQLVAPHGRAGLVLPFGIATDETTSAFFGHISAGRLASIISFEEIRKWFPATDDRKSFCILTIGRSERTDFALNLDTLEALRRPERRFSLTPEQIALVNPNTRTCPVFRTEMDAKLTAKIYARVPVLWDESRPDGNPWGLRFGTLFHMSNDSSLFRIAARRHELSDPVPLYEAKMVHQFDHRWATYAGESEESARLVTAAEKADPTFAVTPRYWVERAEVEARLAQKGWTRPWLMGWRDIARSTDERTLIASVVPRVACGDKILLFNVSADADAALTLLAAMNSLVVDYVARQKVGGTSFKYFTMRQIALPSPASLSAEVRGFISSRAFSLVATAEDLLGFVRDVRLPLRPAHDPGRRAVLRAELDATFAALYGLTRDELRYVLDPEDAMGPDFPSETFRVLKKNELRGFGEYRTRRLVLEAWDRLAQSGELPAPVTPRR